MFSLEKELSTWPGAVYVVLLDLRQIKSFLSISERANDNTEPLATYFSTTECLSNMYDMGESNLNLFFNGIVDNVAIKYGKLSKYQYSKDIWR